MYKTAKIILNLVHLLYYAYNITYKYQDKIVVNLHASNMNATIFLHLKQLLTWCIEDAILTTYHIAGTFRMFMLEACRFKTTLSWHSYVILYA